MKTPTIDVQYVADLARITLTPEEKDLFQSQLGEVLQYVEQLNKADIEGVEPAAHTHAVSNVLRPDEAHPTFDAETALANAPHAANQLFMVTKVVE